MVLENPNLPEEILIEIFTRIPAKTVGRCRCLSKTWRTQLSSSEFVNPHLSCRTSPEILLLIDDEDYSLHTVDVVENTVVSRKLDLGITWHRVLGSCNGLVLLSKIDCELYLVNPITLEYFNLPRLPFEESIIKNNGVCYATLSRDYKAVVVWSHLFAKAAPSIDRLIDVYSVKSDAWKSVDTPTCYDSGTDDGTFMNGAVHWVSFLEKDDSPYEVVIEAFDLDDHVFRRIPAPPTAVCTNENVWYLNNLRLLVLEGCLCMLWKRIRKNGDTELWMMKQYGLADSWTKFTIHTNGQWDVRLPLCFIGDGEILLVTRNYKLIVYNLKEGTRKDIVVDGVSGNFRDGVAFVDSLVSPNHQYSN